MKKIELFLLTFAFSVLAGNESNQSVDALPNLGVQQTVTATQAPVATNNIALKAASTGEKRNRCLDDYCFLAGIIFSPDGSRRKQTDCLGSLEVSEQSERIFGIIGALAQSGADHALPNPAIGMIAFCVMGVFADISHLVRTYITLESRIEKCALWRKITFLGFFAKLQSDFLYSIFVNQNPKYGPRVFASFLRWMMEVHKDQGIKGVDDIIYGLIEAALLDSNFNSVVLRRTLAVGHKHKVHVNPYVLYDIRFMFEKERYCIYNFTFHVVVCFLQLCRQSIEPYESKFDLLPVLSLIFERVSGSINPLAYELSRKYRRNELDESQKNAIIRLISSITGRDFTISLHGLFGHEPVELVTNTNLEPVDTKTCSDWFAFAHPSRII
jgi:hypothetical protein